MVMAPQDAIVYDTVTIINRKLFPSNDLSLVPTREDHFRNSVIEALNNLQPLGNCASVVVLMLQHQCSGAPYSLIMDLIYSSVAL